MQRVGRIAHRMAGEGYEPPAINLVVRVLFVSTSKAELRRCFELLDADGSGALQLSEVKLTLTRTRTRTLTLALTLTLTLTLTLALALTLTRSRRCSSCAARA